ncbi:hypothetical protein K474DRAFT_1611639 [Panus rudis PR-1116 ss-1]|nr:hypothetical protein K474DRAFT_1611639 [Panus rudis PR-1116 ss-1]
MIDPAEVTVPGMSRIPTGLQYSDSSEGSDLRDLVDRQLPPQPQDDSPPTPSSPISTMRSSLTNGQSSLHDTHTNSKRRKSRKERDQRHSSGAQRDLVKLLVSEQVEENRLRRYLRLALEKLDNETARAQEAEKRALELAERFRVVNEARVTAQLDLNKANEELRLYKIQYQNSQNEVKRAHEILQTLEHQRDEAEAAAARARTTARRYREEQLAFRAREEGRRQGYEEGLRRAREETRTDNYYRDRRDRGPVDDTEEGEQGVAEPMAGDAMTEVEETEPLDNFSVLNLPTMPQGAQGSRFRETGMSPATTNASIYPPNPRPPSVLREERREEPKFVRPVPVHNSAQSPSHPFVPIPPDGYVPHAAEDGSISLPPAHEMSRPPPTPQSIAEPLPVRQPSAMVGAAESPADTVARDYAYGTQPKHGMDRPRSPQSVADSFQSTAISSFDIVNSPPKGHYRNFSRDSNNSDRDRDRDRDLRNKRSGLSVIHEVSSSAGNTPSQDFGNMPEPISFPIAPGGRSGGSPPEWSGEGSYSRPELSRSRRSSQRAPDDLRYDNPGSVDEWRRSAADELRPDPSRRSMRRPSIPPSIVPPDPEASVPSVGMGIADGRPPSAASTHRRAYSPMGARPLSPSNSLRVPGHSGRTSRGAFSESGSVPNRTGTSSADISIHIEPPSASASNFSPVSVMHADMLSPHSAAAPLPPSQPIQQQSSEPMMIPTAPNSPSMMQRYPSMGRLSSEPSLNPNFSFGPSGPSVPYPNIVPAGVSEPPVAQSSPRQPVYDIYGNSTPNSRDRDRETSRPPSAASTLFDMNNGPKKHGRTRSAGGIPSNLVNSENISAANTFSTIPGGPSVRPPSAMSSSPATVNNSNMGGTIRRASTPSRPTYEEAPLSPGVKYPDPPFAGNPDEIRKAAAADMSPRSTSSRLFNGAGAGHHRSLSLNAGSTPATTARPLSNAPPPKLRRVPSTGSVNSAMSGTSRFSHYDPQTYLDPAFASSSDKLIRAEAQDNFQSPMAVGNSKVNASSASLLAGLGAPGPSASGTGSPNVSQVSLPTVSAPPPVTTGKKKKGRKGR